MGDNPERVLGEVSNILSMDGGVTFSLRGGQLPETVGNQIGLRDFILCACGSYEVLNMTAKNAHLERISGGSEFARSRTRVS